MTWQTENKRKALLYGIYSTRKLFQFTQFSYKTIRLTVYAMFHGKQKVGKHIYPSFKVLSSIYHCLEIGTCELGAQTYIYFFLLGGGAKRNFHQTQIRFFIKHVQILAKGPGIAICSIISQLHCKKVLVFTRVFPAFRPHFDYGFPFCHVFQSHFQPRVLASYFVCYIK